MLISFHPAQRTRRGTFFLRCAIPVLAVLTAGADLMASQAHFQSKPVVTKDKNGARIRFTLKKPTDVEVAVLNAKGTVVRHLAAGWVGGKKAATPLTAGLSQNLVWDGNTDAGQPAKGGPFRVRVSASLRPDLGRILGGDPYHIGQVSGLATDKKGQAYVMFNSYGKGADGPLHIQVFDRTGAYIKTILPAPANLPFEKVKHFGAAQKKDGSWFPFNHWARFPHLALFGTRRKGGFSVWLSSTVTDDGRLILYSPTRIYWINTDGSVTPEGIKGIPIWPKTGKPLGRSRVGPFHLTPSTDGKHYFISGMASGKVPGCKGTGNRAEWPNGSIYRMQSGVGESARPFARVTQQPHSGPYKLAAAHGLTTGPNGRVYVCDRKNGRIAIFDQTGKLTGEVPVAHPDQVIVHRKTGDLIVLVREFTNKARIKNVFLKTFAASGQQWKERASLKLTGTIAFPKIAADTTQEKAIIWIADKGKLLRVEDQGTQLVILENLTDRVKDPLPAADRMAIDEARNELYINDAWAGLYRYNGITGKGEKLPFGGVDLDIGADDNLYILGAVKGISPWMGFKRVTRDGKPAPFKAWGGKNESKDLHYGRFGAGYSAKGVCVAHDGKTYMLDMGAWNNYWVTVYDQTGKLLGGPRSKGKVEKRPAGGLIDNVPSSCGGIQVDRQGNIYIGIIGTPPGFQYPDGMDGASPIHRHLMGSVVKFPPTGGTFWPPIDKKEAQRTPKPKAGPGVIQLQHSEGRGERFAIGALQVFPGSAPTSTFGSCACRSPRFHLDDYGRLFMPDVVTFQVRVYDAAGNPIRTIGQYGNVDSAGPDSLIPQPNIAFAWPISACLAGRNLYVADVQNRRVTRVDLGYEEEAMVPIR